jgi:hypothetical protein
VRLHPIPLLILLYNFKELTKSIEVVERIEAKVNNSKKRMVNEKGRKGRNPYDLGYLF